jgi:hypothetical protein
MTKKRKPPKRAAVGDRVCEVKVSFDAAVPPETAKRFIGELRSELGARSQLAKEREAEARERFEERARRAGPPGDGFLVASHPSADPLREPRRPAPAPNNAVEAGRRDRCYAALPREQIGDLNKAYFTPADSDDALRCLRALRQAAWDVLDGPSPNEPSPTTRLARLHAAAQDADVVLLGGDYNSELRRAIVRMLTWVPRGPATKPLAKALIAAAKKHGWHAEHFDEPLFGSQAWSYPLLGVKEEARTFHGLIAAVCRAAGVDHDEVMRQFYRDRDAARRAEAERRARDRARKKSRAKVASFLRNKKIPLDKRVAKLDELLREKIASPMYKAQDLLDRTFASYLLDWLVTFYGGGIDPKTNSARIRALLAPFRAAARRERHRLRAGTDLRGAMGTRAETLVRDPKTNSTRIGKMLRKGNP